MRPRVLAAVLATLAACATDVASRAPRALAVASSPSADCVEVGRIEAREATELLSSPDVLTAAAIEQLRIRAARRGATHVVVAESPMTGMVSYTTTARAEGLALRCPPPG